MVSFVGESGLRWSYDPDARIGDRSFYGEVFRGTGMNGQAVAVKRVPLRWDRESERRRREREVEIDQVLATVSSEHVMRLHDTGRVGDDLLLVMPLADRSLASAVATGDLDEAAGVNALLHVAQGLVELAEIPVLHRDLKPANVLGFGGLWKLADFGIARNLLESTGTYTFRGVGTPYYMAPELWAGRPATVKSDMYAFGVLAFEVLAGYRPFSAADEAGLRRQHQQDPPPALPASIPAAICRLVLRLLAKDPAKRPQDARAVVESLIGATKPLGEMQEMLRVAALKHQQWLSTLEGLRADDAAEEESDAQQVPQALADLRQIVEDAADQARDALPELGLNENGNCWRLKWGDFNFGVSVEVWLPDPLQPGMSGLGEKKISKRLALGNPLLVKYFQLDDPLVVAGEIGLMRDSPEPSANIVCEVRGGRLFWSLLRFGGRLEAFRRRTEFKLPGFTSVESVRRPMGMHRGEFMNNRALMRNADMPHTTIEQHVPLTADVIVDLLHEDMNRS